jgi:hypothetical protein
MRLLALLFLVVLVSGCTQDPGIRETGTLPNGSDEDFVYPNNSPQVEHTGPGYQDQGLASCGEGNELFSVFPMDPDDLLVVVPLGGLTPPGHTFPTRHIYLRFTYEPIDYKMPVYSPGDILVTSISSMEQNEFTDYTLSFYSCSEVHGYLSHLSDIEDAFKDELTDPDWCNEYDTGGTHHRMCTKTVSIPVSAGERVASAGGTAMGHIDFELYDLRTEPLGYVNKERWTSTMMNDSLHIVCPVDYFTPDVRDAVYAMFGGHDGRPRTIPPLCGQVMYDVAGTAQGIWYARGSEPSTFEDPHMFLAYDNIDPTRAVFSMGTSGRDLPVGKYYFDPETSGKVNRRFDQVTPGEVYCFETEGEWGESNGFTIILELPTETTLRIQKRSSGSCGSGPWSFTDPAEFER